MNGRPAVFVDRDGTIVAERSYLADPERVSLIPGAAEALRRLRGEGLAIVVVTNQSGIARGLYRLEDYHAVAERVDTLLAAGGASPEATHFCPHHPDFTGPCDCRKPDTGMHRRAAAALGLDLAASYYVGDKLTDVLPSTALGGQGILVRTGYGAEAEADVAPGTWVVDDLAAAASRILGSDRPAAGEPFRR